MFFTFYSFKGGVGRSMTVANIAELLYERGLRVLMIDFDLEAPGLERYFEAKSDLSEKRGVIDMVLSYKTLSALPPQIESAEGSSSDEDFSASFEPLVNFISPIYDNQGTGAALYLMTAGRRLKNNYGQFAESVSGLDWDDFYLNHNGARFFDWLRADASKYFDVVLVDSRTGITEMTGICTYHLADVVVMFVAPNRQNLEGTLLIANGLQKRKVERTNPSDRQLEFLIIPSRVDISESESVADFKTSFLADMTPFYNPSLKFENNRFDDLKIPYIPRYAYYEKVAAREREHPVASELLAAFNRLLAAMVELAPKNSRFYKRYYSKSKSVSIVADGAWLPKPPANFAGREWVFEFINKWLTGESSSTLLLTGNPGSGKSALAYRLVQFSRGEVDGDELENITPGLLTYAHFCNPADVHSVEPEYFITSLSLALANRYQAFAAALAQVSDPDVQIELRQNIGTVSQGAQVKGIVIESLKLTSPDVGRALVKLVLEPLEKLVSQGQVESPLILVDGLEAVASLSSENNLLGIISLIVRRLPQVRFILTSRPDPRVLAELQGTDILDLNADAAALARDLRIYALDSLQEFPEEERKLIAEQIVKASDGNFLYMEFAVNELRSHSRETGKLDFANMPRGILGIYQDFVRREIGADQKRWIERDGLLFGVLAMQKGDGLRLSQLAGVLKQTEIEFISMLRPWMQYLSGSMPQGPFKFFHVSFREFLLTNIEYPISPTQANEMIADFFIEEYGSLWKTCTDDYALRYTASHLQDALNATTVPQARKALEDKLTALLTDIEFFEARSELLDFAEVTKDLEVAPKSAAILGTLGLIYYWQRREDNAIETYQEALEIARARGDRLAENVLLGNLGLAYYSTNEITRAIDCFEQALRICRELDLKENEVTWLSNLGNSYILIEQFDRAIAYYKEALQIAEAIADSQTAGALLRNLGFASQIMGNVDEAATLFTRAAATIEKTEDRYGLASIWLAHGNLNVKRGEFQQAIALYEQALEVMEGIKNFYGASQILANLGIVHERLGRSEEAIKYFNMALERMKVNGDEDGIARTLVDLGNVAFNMGDLSQARSQYLKAIEILDQRDAVADTIPVWNNLGAIYRQEGKLVNAVESYQRSLEIARTLQNRKYEGDILSNLGNAYQDLGNAKDATSYYEQALAIYREVGDEQNQKVISQRLEAIYQSTVSSSTGVTISGNDNIIAGDVRSSDIVFERGASNAIGRTISRSELDELLAPLENLVRNAASLIEEEDDVWETVSLLKSELAKGSMADDSILARTIDKLASLVPGVGGFLAKLLTSNDVVGIIGPVTQFVIEKFTGLNSGVQKQRGNKVSTAEDSPRQVQIPGK